MAIKSFEEINAWQKARELVREVYRASSVDPFKSDWGLRNQITRASVSIMSNIAEGFGRHTDKEFSRFLDIARGSSCEVQSLLFVALDAGYVSKDLFSKIFKLADESIALIAGFKRYLTNSPESVN